jgi:hypothetical protein
VPGGIDSWIARAAGVITDAFGDDPHETSLNSTATSPVPLGRQVREAEKHMARLDRKRTSLNMRLVASLDHTEQTRLGIELDAIQEELTVAEEYWLSLIE